MTAWAGIAAALPRLVGPSPAERAALAVEGVLRQAREAAREGRSPVTVRLQDGGRTVAAPSLGARADLPADIVARPEGVRGWGSAGGTFEENDEATIVFLPDGSSSGCRVTLSDRTLAAPEAPAAVSQNRSHHECADHHRPSRLRLRLPGTSSSIQHGKWLTSGPKVPTACRSPACSGGSHAPAPCILD